MQGLQVFSPRIITITKRGIGIAGGCYCCSRLIIAEPSKAGLDVVDKVVYGSGPVSLFQGQGCRGILAASASTPQCLHMYAAESETDAKGI